MLNTKKNIFTILYNNFFINCNKIISVFQAFGLPAIVAHTGGEPMLFFGSDRFPVLAQEIGEKWLGPEPDVPQTRL